MAKFLTELDAKCIDDGSWLLAYPLGYDSDIIGPVDAPAGFKTDFASVPRVPLVYIAFGDRAHHESVIHDYLYRSDSVPVVSRAVADRVFLEAMKCRGKPWHIRWPMYLGVRAGGWTVYHKKNVEDGI